MGVPPVIILILMGFSLSKTNQLLGIPMTMETARAGHKWPRIHPGGATNTAVNRILRALQHHKGPPAWS